jgi:hypothetical protein
MASPYGSSPGDRLPGKSGPGDPSFGDRNWQNGGQRTPDSAYQNRGAPSPALGTPRQDREFGEEMRRSGERNRAKPQNGRTASGQTRVCRKCGESLTGQFVRALDGTFHLDCFRCKVSMQMPKELG